MQPHSSVSHPEVTADRPCTGHYVTALGDDVCSSWLRAFDEITRRVEMSDNGQYAVNLHIAFLKATGFRPAPE